MLKVATSLDCVDSSKCLFCFSGMPINTQFPFLLYHFFPLENHKIPLGEATTRSDNFPGTHGKSQNPNCTWLFTCLPIFLCEFPQEDSKQPKSATATKCHQTLQREQVQKGITKTEIQSWVSLPRAHT